MTTSSWLWVAGAAVGAIVGSFIGVVAVRLPRGESIVAGRSRCDACGTALRPLQLLPVLSYLALNGRCRSCRAPIGSDPLIAELAGALVASLAVQSTSSPCAALATAMFGWGLIALALIDLRHLWLPDVITIPLLAGGLLAAPLLPEIGLGNRLLGVVLGYAALEALRIGYRRLRGREGLGGGDAKLLAAIGAWLGAAALPPVLLIAATLGLCFAGFGYLRGRSIDRDTELPLGSLLAAAALAVLFLHP